MKQFMRLCMVNCLVLGLSTFSPLATMSAVADTCGSGLGEPPFLSAGVKDNLLLLLDNSGSMLDLAYVDVADQCYDDKYDNTKSYAGYFNEDSWYTYDFDNDERFETISSAPSSCDYTAGGTGTSQYLCVTIDSSAGVTTFAATGKFMNWAASSKFDIQKEILTGGKYDDYNKNLQMETRGCQGRRFIKQVTLDQDDAGQNYKLTLGVRGPMEVYDVWLPKYKNDHPSYDQGDIVLYNNNLYICNETTCESETTFGASTGWVEYKETRWYPNHLYQANTAVFYIDETDIDKSAWFWTQKGGTSANVSTIYDDNNVTWIPYEGTNVEIFSIVAGGFNQEACQDVIDMMGSLDGTSNDGDTDDENTSLGQIKKKTKECMAFDDAGPLHRARLSSFNHAMQECWYYEKHGRWQPGQGTVNSLERSCERVYDSIPPSMITPWDTSYVCYGSYDVDAPLSKSYKGYIGRCWEKTTAIEGCRTATCGTVSPRDFEYDNNVFWRSGSTEFYCAGDEVKICNTNNCNDNYSDPDNWGDYEICDQGGGGNLDEQWTDDTFYYFDPCRYTNCTSNNDLINSCTTGNVCGDWDCTTSGQCYNTADTTGYYCVDQAIKDFCGRFNVAEVIDPSDATTSTGEVWNIPAFLTDSGVMAQLDLPIAVMRGYIEQSSAPEGILHSTAQDLRIGAMAFNDVGAKTECTDSTSPAIIKYCPEDPGLNKDGAKVISGIKLGSEVDADTGKRHVDDLAAAINDVHANSWTPLAEAMYNAIGYFTQRSDIQLNSDDFTISTDADPVTNWCQENHVLIITEGASTADVNPDVATLAATYPDGDNDATTVADSAVLNGACTDGLQGSSYLDDLTNFAHLTYSVRGDEDHVAAAKALYGDNNYTIDGEIRKGITTHVVVAGDLRGSVDSDDECTPAKLMNDAASQGGTDLIVSADPQQLEEDLTSLFASLQNRASSGSAASVISSSRGGEGAIYQAIFWPEKKWKDSLGVTDDAYTVDWAGDVHALFIDAQGFMYEDTDGDAQFDEGADNQVTIYYDDTANKSMACYGSSPTCDSPVAIEDLKFIWSAADWLNDNSLNTQGNRSTYKSDEKRRYLYTWDDLNNDGIVDPDTEWLPFEDKTVGGADTDWADGSLDPSRSSVFTDFNVTTNAEVNRIVKWVRGEDTTGDTTLRSRLTKDKNGNEITWRLGDVIHSTPMTVSSPAEGYHLLYNDYSYAQFFARWKNRRHMIYFGANDGMLHAVNGGFYHADTKSFCRELNANYNPDDTAHNNPCVASGPSLGAEMWGYVPYNLLPHLQCLTKPEYAGEKHKYFVDLRPRIFDVQIFEEESACVSDKKAEGCKHPNGWGTILVGGMRFGGAPVAAKDLAGAQLGDDPATADVTETADNRQFISAYFIFDITDPENPPVLLGEMTQQLDSSGNPKFADMGYTTSIPTMVIMKQGGTSDAPANAYDETDGSHNQWYLILGSGPHGSDALKGVSDQEARIAVIPLDWLVETSTTSKSPLRIPAAEPTAVVEGGRFILDPTPDDTSDTIPNGFTGDLITIDVDINPSSENYMADAVYFGTVEGNFSGDNWAGGGRLYRLMTRAKNAPPAGSGAVGDGWYFGTSVSQAWSTPATWELTTLINNNQPITAAPSVGYDGYNFWVYFGTGRFFDANDKTDTTQQSFYGIKEPMKMWNDSTTMEFLGTTVVAPAAHGSSASGTFPTTGSPGDKGLLKTDEIRVAEAATPAAATLSCRDSITGCLPDTEVTTLADLIEYTAGKGGTDDPDWSNSADGWFYDFYPYGNRERNIGQATLFGGLTLFTTYQPYNDVCRAEGESYLYALYYQTGTAWHNVVFKGGAGKYDEGDVKEKYSMGRGLATTPNLHASGDGESVKAFLQSSTGEIIPVGHDTATGDSSSGRTSWRQCTQ